MLTKNPNFSVHTKNGNHLEWESKKKKKEKKKKPPIFFNDRNPLFKVEMKRLFLLEEKFLAPQYRPKAKSYTGFFLIHSLCRRGYGNILLAPPFLWSSVYNYAKPVACQRKFHLV